MISPRIKIEEREVGKMCGRSSLHRVFRDVLVRKWLHEALKEWKGLNPFCLEWGGRVNSSRCRSKHQDFRGRQRDKSSEGGRVGSQATRLCAMLGALTLWWDAGEGLWIEEWCGYVYVSCWEQIDRVKVGGTARWPSGLARSTCGSRWWQGSDNLECVQKLELEVFALTCEKNKRIISRL